MTKTEARKKGRKMYRAGYLVTGYVSQDREIGQGKDWGVQFVDPKTGYSAIRWQEKGGES